MKRNHLFLLVLTSIFVFFSLSVADQEYELQWAKSVGSIDTDVGWKTAFDQSGNIVVVGYFSETATFGAGEPNETTLTSAGGYDFFIAKYDDSGNLLWAKRAGGSSHDLMNGGLAIDKSNNILFTARFSGTATFGAGEPNETTLTSAGDFDICIAKYNSDGDLQWAKRAGGSSLDEGGGISVDSSSVTVYYLVTGRFAGTATFGPGETNETTLTSAGSSDIFIAKYNNDGSLVWARRDGGSDADRAYDIAVDDNGNFSITGRFSSTATFGAGQPNETSLVSAGSYDIFTARYTSAGVLLWAKRGGGTSSNEEAQAITSEHLGSCYIAGQFRGTAIFGQGESNETTLVSSGNNDVVVAKYNANGELIWNYRGFIIATRKKSNA